MLHNESIRYIQFLLNKAGYPVKSINGKFDRTTAMMINNFCFDHDLGKDINPEFLIAYLLGIEDLECAHAKLPSFKGE